ncbi:MAG: glycosyltransferase family 2 protein, partial [Candidatus Palauibacterales bacterium]|nr:glycosyltransferase family 2 protein [Candidatus Palauibacterales bacterium]
MSASRPAVSVALPCRNVAPWLPECIESLGSQSLRDFEVVAVNDGSQDETGSILRRWSARDGRVRVIELRDDEVTPSTDARSGGGLVRALNTAVRASRAPFLARMDGDDTARPQRLERQRELLSRRSDLAACGTA